MVFVKAEKLFLPESITQLSDFENAEIILVINTNRCSDLLALHTTDNIQLYSKNASIELDIFSLKIQTVLELHLLYNQFTVGFPELANFKL